MKKNHIAISILAIAAGGCSTFVNAGTVGVDQCVSTVHVPATYKGNGALKNPAYDASRTWDLTSASACGLVQGNVNSNADIEALGGVFDLGPTLNWSYQNEVTGGGDTSGWLDIELESGAWGSSPVAGTWTFAPTFWNQFEKAVLTFHMGNGQPQELADGAAFLITAGTYTGDWSFSQLNANGGGFSNIKLWTTPRTTKPFEPPPLGVPEPGILLLLGSALTGLSLRLRGSHRKA